jgi:hypothetical protein
MPTWSLQKSIKTIYANQIDDQPERQAFTENHDRKRSDEDLNEKGPRSFEPGPSSQVVDQTTS